MNGVEWPRGPYRWVENEREHISIPFTWNLPRIREDILNGNLFGKPIVGGPAVKLMPDYLADIADIGTSSEGVLQRVNPLATRTTVGCPNSCSFCAVPIIEGEYRELNDWPDLPIICDNNLLAASRKHFDNVIDRLKHHKGVDFNQGLDARLMSQYHADRLAELDAMIRISWDYISDEKYIMDALIKLRLARIPKDNIRVYVLFGWNDTPADALYRLNLLYRVIGITPNPMRYVPLNSLNNHYVGDGWTEFELTKMHRYWSRIKYLGSVPYDEFDHTK